MVKNSTEPLFPEEVDADIVRRPCPNAGCRDGYTSKRAGGVRVCPACDGVGFLRSTAENRRHYHALRAFALELELQSRGKNGGDDALIFLDMLDPIGDLARRSRDPLSAIRSQ